MARRPADPGRATSGSTRRASRSTSARSSCDPSRWEPSIAQAAQVFQRAARSTASSCDCSTSAAASRPATSSRSPPIERLRRRHRRRDRAALRRRLPARSWRSSRAATSSADAGRAARRGRARSSQKSYDGRPRWVYLDVGRFGGLAETEGEAIRYRIVDRPRRRADRPGRARRPHLRQRRHPLRAGAATGCRSPAARRPRRLLGTGAYTTTYSSVGSTGSHLWQLSASETSRDHDHPRLRLRRPHPAARLRLGVAVPAAAAAAPPRHGLHAS